MDILSVNKFFWRKGGSETVFFGEKKLLESDGHTVIPFSMKGEENYASEFSKYFVDKVDYDDAGLFNKALSASKVIYSVDARAKMKRLLADFSPDVAHFHIFQHQISPSVFGPLRKRGVPIVLTLHDLKPLCPNYKMYVNGVVCEACKGRRFYKAIANKCTKDSAVKSAVNAVEMYLHYALGYYQGVDKYIAVSKFYRQKMIEHGFDSRQIVYLPNFVDASKFNVTGRDGRYALFFGRLSQEKGIQTLIDAAKLCDDIPIRVIGTGPMEQELKATVAREAKADVEFLGYKSGRELEDQIANASFTVVPSVWYENCPMTVLESMALGTPVVGASIGGIPELIEEGVDGITFDAGDPEDLARSMQTMWDDRRALIDMGAAGRKKIEERFNPASHLQSLKEIYRDVMHNV